MGLGGFVDQDGERMIGSLRFRCFLVIVSEVTSGSVSSLPWYVTADVHLVLSGFPKVSFWPVFFSNNLLFSCFD